MAAPRSGDVQDFLVVRNLRGPLLDDYYGSPIQKEDVLEIAREVSRRYLAKVPRETGNLASTARVSAHRSRVHRDRRWEAEFSVGGPRAPYVVAVEEGQHILARVLAEMGFFTGDVVTGPGGRIPVEHRAPRQTKLGGD